MEAAIVGAAARPILTKLSSFVIQEIGPAASVKQDLDNLKKNVKLISALLRDAEKDQNSKQESITLWIQEMTHSIYDADDVLEEFNYEILSTQRKQNNSFQMTTNFFSTSNPLLLRFKNGHKIRDINIMLDRVVTQGTKILGLTQVLLHPVVGESSAPQDPRQTLPVGDVSKIIGRDADKSKVIDMLLQPSGDLSVVAIIGLGGLGKTTLAKLIYKDTDNIKFDERIWVCVSTDFNVHTILKVIATDLSVDVDEMLNTKRLIKGITEKLSKKKYLLILDDVWNTELMKWKDLVDCLFEIGADKESKILVTTRSDEVALCMHCDSRFQLKGLSDEDSWSLFRQMAFSKGGAKETTSVTTIGKKIVARCKGVPLAISTLGALLHTKQENEWVSIEKSDLWNLTTNESGIMPALRLSYNYLPSPCLKQCFAYCSIFPKDHEFEKDDLIQLWIAQGFIQSTPGSKDMLENTGNDYFNILVWNSFFQDVKTDYYGNIKGCKMHDLFHDLAQDISKSEILVVDTTNVNDSLTVRHLYYLENKGTMPTIPNSHKLRTLFLSCQMRENLFAKFKCLRVLNIKGGYFIKKLPKSIGKLKSLRYLNVSNTKIKEFPTSILKLYSLQTIRFMRCESFGELPKQLGSMISLTHICFDNYHADKMPFKLGRLTSLQTLSRFNVGHDEGHKIEELGPLERLTGELHIKYLERIGDINEVKSANLVMKTNLYKLILEWSIQRSNDVIVNMDEDVIECLQPPPKLRSLTIKNFDGGSFPGCMLMPNVDNVINSNYILPDSLVEIKLMNCRKCERIPTLGELPSLKFLEIVGMDNLKAIGREFYSTNNKFYDNKRVCGGGSSSRCIILFPSLMKLKLENLNNLVKWSEASTNVDMAIEGGTVEVFPCLEILSIERVSKLTHLPEGILQNNKKLTKIRLSNCDMLECIRREDDYVGLENLVSLREMVIEKCPKLSHIGSMRGLTCLIKLIIESCHEITRLPNGLGSCTSLKYLRIWGFSKLEALPDWLNNLSSLQSLKIMNCPKLSYIGNMHGFTSLIELRIIGCHELTNLPIGLGSCASLKTLHVDDCKNLISFVAEEDFRELKSLSSLNITSCGKLKGDFPLQGSLSNFKELRMGPFYLELESFPFNFNMAVLKSRLKSLELMGWPKLMSLPQQIQHLCALERMWIIGFEGLEALPDWLENLSSLQYLDIWYCENLKYLPSLQAMQRLTNLKYMRIWDCPVLEERCNKESGVEWSKISHIPKITLNNQRVQNLK